MQVKRCCTHLCCFMLILETWKSLSWPRYCIQVQTHEDVPHPLRHLGDPKFLLNQKGLFYFFILIVLFLYTQPEEET